MSLRFPNESRSYDPTRRAVRFWGHDSAMEASFFVSEEALKRVQPDLRFDESGLLGAFDANRDLICGPRSRFTPEVAEVLTTWLRQISDRCHSACFIAPGMASMRYSSSIHARKMPNVSLASRRGR